MSVTKQQYYRRLMKEQKSKGSSSQPVKIEHPFARYNALDQLMCVICSCHIKSEILWSTHLQSRKHKESISALKSKQSRPQSQPQSQPGSALPSKEDQESKKVASHDSTKRKLSSELEESSNGAPPKKKSKKKAVSATPAPTPSGLPANFFDSGVSKKFYPHGEEPYYKESDSEGEGEGEGPAESNTTPTTREVTATATPPGLPANFFDRGSDSTPAQSKSGSGDPKKSLPEGFFDDPKLDAKARKVEYKDPMDEEWEKFQKSIQKENDVSEVIVFEEDEETMEERELEQVNQQVSCFTKAEELRQKHEALLAKRADEEGSQSSSNLVTMDSESSEDEVDFDEFLSWRAKIS